ncbi:MAG: GDCCVxC domain-containing (seleno)protein [Pyrinomonadaceae bacterium]
MNTIATSTDLPQLSMLTCPECGYQKTESVPLDTCVFFYECTSCRKLLRPLPGDCCVYCSFGSAKCPSQAAERFQ